LKSRAVTKSDEVSQSKQSRKSSIALVIPERNPSPSKSRASKPGKTTPETRKRNPEDEIPKPSTPLNDDSVNSTPKKHGKRKKKSPAVSEKPTRKRSPVTTEELEPEEAPSPSKKRGSSIREFEQKYDVISDDDEVPVEKIVNAPNVDSSISDELPIAQRRSKRIKVKPLRFWLGEKIVYGMGDDGSRSFECVKPAEGLSRKK
jgi:hypothetical protein